MSEIRMQTILLIEDDPGDALLIREMLEQQECKAQLVTVERLSAGIGFLQQHACDVVLLDMNLPGQQRTPHHDPPAGGSARHADNCPDRPLR